MGALICRIVEIAKTALAFAFCVDVGIICGTAPFTRLGVKFQQSLQA